VPRRRGEGDQRTEARGLMFPTALLFLTAGHFLAAANPGAGFLQNERYAFCHDPDYPLSGKDARWCPIIGEQNDICPTLPAACAKPPQPVDIDVTLGGGSCQSGGNGQGNCESDDTDGDGNGTGQTAKPDNGDGDAEGRAS